MKHLVPRSLGALAMIAIAGACIPPFRAAPPPMRVLVYNIHAGRDAKGVDNLERVAAIVKETGAHVVLLQEVDRGTARSDRVDQIARLAALTEMKFAFGSTLDYQGGKYGIAVLSRWNIVGDTLIPLPIDPPQARAGGSYEPRGALRVTLAAPGGAITIVNTHIDASRTDYYRRQEAMAVANIATAAVRPGGLVLVGGDMNAEPETAVIGIMRSAGWRDLWKKCGRGDGLTFPADRPVKRIDYLFARDGVGCVGARVLSADASDHRAVLFELGQR